MTSKTPEAGQAPSTPPGGTIPDTIHGERVILHRATVADLPALLPITRTPEVRYWWGPQEDLGEEIERGEVPRFVVLIDGAVAGLIQFYEEADPEFRHAGMDLYLDPRTHGRGYGTETVRTLARWLVTERGHHRLVIDPAADNHAAIRCYTKVGFRPVGVMRQYQVRYDRPGEWRDGLLMDALAAEILA